MDANVPPENPPTPPTNSEAPPPPPPPFSEPVAAAPIPPPPPEAPAAPPPTQPSHSAPPPPQPPPRPPAFSAPPPILPPPPAPRRRCTGWKITAVLLLILLLFSWLIIMGQLAGGSLGSTTKVERKRQMLHEILVDHRGSKNKIAVIKVEGVISSSSSDGPARNMVDHIRDQLDAASKDIAVKAVVLKINSPGGEVLASDEIYNAIKDFQESTDKPVVASMQTLAASGGYYVAAPCRWIVANDLTITGSIGVIMHGWNFSGLMNKIGVRSETYKSGKYKDMLSPFRQPDDITPEERELVQDLIVETYGKFTNIVAAGRDFALEANSALDEKGRQLAPDWTSYADGRVFSGTTAYNLGFVDELGDFEMAVDRAQTLASIGNANLIEYRQQFDFSDFFQIFGQTETRTVKVDVGLEMPKLQPGCLYFLYRHAVP